MSPLRSVRNLKGFNHIVSCSLCNFSTPIKHASFLLSRHHFGIQNPSHTMPINIEGLLMKNLNNYKTSPAELCASLCNKSKFPCPKCKSLQRWIGGIAVTQKKFSFI